MSPTLTVKIISIYVDVPRAERAPVSPDLPLGFAVAKLPSPSIRERRFKIVGNNHGVKRNFNSLIYHRVLLFFFLPELNFTNLFQRISPLREQ